MRKILWLIKRKTAWMFSRGKISNSRALYDELNRLRRASWATIYTECKRQYLFQLRHEVLIRNLGIFTPRGAAVTAVLAAVVAILIWNYGMKSEAPKGSIVLAIIIIIFLIVIANLFYFHYVDYYLQIAEEKISACKSSYPEILEIIEENNFQDEVPPAPEKIEVDFNLEPPKIISETDETDDDFIDFFEKMETGEAEPQTRNDSAASVIADLEKAFGHIEKPARNWSIKDYIAAMKKI